MRDENQQPFFYLGDTAWELFHRLDKTETELYLQDRATKGFAVIQAVVLAELDGLTQPNRKDFKNLIRRGPMKALLPGILYAWNAINFQLRKIGFWFWTEQPQEEIEPQIQKTHKEPVSSRLSLPRSF